VAASPRRRSADGGAVGGPFPAGATALRLARRGDVDTRCRAADSGEGPNEKGLANYSGEVGDDKRRGTASAR
jgi:hypothetical protein